MKAIILTAGYGRRMRPLTHTTHKTLLRINHKTVIEWIIDALLSHHITEIVIVTGYLAADLRAFLDQAYPQLTFEYIHNERYAETNNIFSMAIALENTSITSDILLIECDLIFEPGVLTRLLNAPHPNAALVDRYQRGMDGTVVDIDAQNVITSVIPPHLQSETFDFTHKYKTLNIYRFSKEFCQGDFKNIITHYARTIDSNAYYELVLGILIYLQRNTIYAVPLQGERWSEIDDPNDLKIAQYLFEPEQRQSLLASAHGGFWNYPVLDFCYLRNMHFPSGALLSELRNSLPHLLHNYGSSQTLLNQKLAYFLLCDPSHVTVLNGAAQAFPFLQQYFSGDKVSEVEPDSGPRTILVPSPTFGEYSRLFPSAIRYPDHPNLQHLNQKVEPNSVIFFVNPNNPTGTTLPSQELYEFALSHPQATIGVDESFIDFSDQPSLETFIAQKPLPNLFVLKSLSKSLGVPGLRLGYLYSANPSLHQALRSCLPIWNLNALAEHFLECLLKHRPALTQAFEQTKRDRTHLAQALQSLSMVETVYPSGGNFLHATLSCTPSTLQAISQELLIQHNLYIKDISDRFSDNKSHIRLAVRLPSEHVTLINALKSALNDAEATIA